MTTCVAYGATSVKSYVDLRLNDGTVATAVRLRPMTHADQSAVVTRIHKQANPPLIHYLMEWIEHRGLRQADVVRALGVDKATVSRWCRGDMPENKNLGPLIEYLQLEAPSDLFRHPNDTWLRRFFEGRSQEEIEHIQKSLEVTFPKRNGTEG